MAEIGIALLAEIGSVHFTAYTWIEINHPALLLQANLSFPSRETWIEIGIRLARYIWNNVVSLAGNVD